MGLKKMLNIGERAVFEITKQVAESSGIEVFAKVRVADAIEIDRSGVSNEHYSYALKAHFDFLVARSDAPLIAIEFDGPGHDSVHDHLKNDLCDRFGLPLVRVTLGACQRAELSGQCRAFPSLPAAMPRRILPPGE
jgi:hypothetical protein